MSTTSSVKPGSPADDVRRASLREIERRLLWLAVRMVDYANREVAAPDGMKVGGHQASSSSIVSIMTALWFGELDHDDRVAVKPHASPVLHAAEYLLGWLDESYLRRLRGFGGLQPYPSRTKDPVPVDYSTGSVGLGAAAPLFGALTQSYVSHRFGAAARGRYFSLIGDAELDEGNIWEAILDTSTRGLDRAVWIVDLNRQSLDRVVPMIRTRELARTFEAAGWNVVELKYGRKLRTAFARPGGETLRRRIDELPNQVYQQLFAAQEETVRATLEEGLGAIERTSLRECLEPDQGSVGTLIRDLGGHDLGDLAQAFAATRQATRPTLVLAYTIKGFGLPIAGNPLNHSALLSEAQIDALRASCGLEREDEWGRIDPGSPAGALVAESAERLGPRERRVRALRDADVPAASQGAVFGRTTQEAFGRVLVQIGRDSDVADRIVTAAPDVSVSTSLGGWINRVGVFGPDEEPDVDAGGGLAWRVSRQGQHIELGISEMNLFLLLGQLGLADELTGERLIPIGTVYDPFVCRGLDALIYSLYSEASFIVAGTPSGVTLAREGGAHQSTVTPSLGIELPNLTSYEPAFVREVDWLLRELVARTARDVAPGAFYLRLSTAPQDQGAFDELNARRGAALREDVLRGGYRLREAAPGDDEPRVTLAACGPLVAEALRAADLLAAEEGIAASVIALTSPDLLFREWRALAGGGITNPRDLPARSHLEAIFAPDGGAPIVSAIDGASHSLAFLGGALGARQLTLGVDRFGQAGPLADIYDAYEISADAIAAAAVTVLARAARA